MLQFLGIPKARETHSFSDLRWICKSAVLQKWYSRTLLPVVQKQLRPSRVHAYGFKRGSSTAHVVGLICQLIYSADVWGTPLIISSQDVRTAFDAMDHNWIAKSLQSRGASAQVTALLMRELTGVEAVMTLPCAGTTSPFNYTRGGKQGGVETPEEWNALIDYLLEALVTSWASKGYGIKLCDGDNAVGSDACLVSHAVWADNIFLFATSTVMMQTMVAELCACISQAELDWKPSSLEFLCAGTLSNETSHAISIEQSGSTLVYKQVPQMHVLGL